MNKIEILNSGKIKRYEFSDIVVFEQVRNDIIKILAGLEIKYIFFDEENFLDEKIKVFITADFILNSLISFYYE